MVVSHPDLINQGATMFNDNDDLNIQSLKPLISPAILLEELPSNNQVIETVANARRQAADIIQGKDQRMIVIVGPCSIHDPIAAKEYAVKLQAEAKRLNNDLLIIMRVYFEKPRTTVGWKGLINDPNLDGSFKVNQGLRLARQLLLDINASGLPAGTEFLDTIIPQFISDLIAWGAIGARTTESQIHRELASGLSMPVGFKNGTTGNVQIAVDAIGAACKPHRFLGVTKQGIPAIVSTGGNKDCHVILRGSSDGPNFSAEHITAATNLLNKAKLTQKIMVDCSHGNSRKDHNRQAEVATDIAEQLKSGSHNICGVMIESNLVAGNQKLVDGNAANYGQSITDACLAWDDTKPVLEQLAKAVQLRNKAKQHA